MTDCPRCGCNDTTPRGEPSRGPTLSSWHLSGTEATQQRTCNHCGKRFRTVIDSTISTAVPIQTRPQPVATRNTGALIPDGVDAVAVYVPAIRPECPKCGHADTKVAGKDGLIRRHRCPSCFAKFRSYEVRPARDT